MPILERPDVDLHYEHVGRGPRLLFLNGSGSSIAEMGLLVEILSARFELAIHDQRGLGLTGLPRCEASTMADYAEDARAVMDEMGWESARVMGLSFGGMVAQELAATHPDRIERLALLCTSSGGAGGSSYPLHELAGLDPEERRRIATSILDRRFDEAWLAEHPADARLAEAMTARQGQELDPERAAGEAHQLAARRGHDAFDRLGRIACPTLVAAGRFDGTAPVENSEAIVGQIAGSELRVYEGGHAFLLQDPAALNEILDFLAA